MATGSLPGRVVNHPPPSSAEVKERVELYLYYSFVTAWHITMRPLPLLIFGKYPQQYIYTSFLFYPDKQEADRQPWDAVEAILTATLPRVCCCLICFSSYSLFALATTTTTEESISSIRPTNVLIDRKKPFRRIQ
jgi:hypothetical protein